MQDIRWICQSRSYLCQHYPGLCLDSANAVHFKGVQESIHGISANGTGGKTKKLKIQMRKFQAGRYAVLSAALGYGAVRSRSSTHFLMGLGGGSASNKSLLWCSRHACYFLICVFSPRLFPQLLSAKELRTFLWLCILMQFAVICGEKECRLANVPPGNFIVRNRFFPTSSRRYSFIQLVKIIDGNFAGCR